MNPSISYDEVAQFLAREARLLDERRYREWLDLFTEDCFYWMPSEVTSGMPLEAAAEFPNRMYRDREKLERFVTGRAESTRAWALQDLRTDHFVTNIEIVDPQRGVVRCKWLLHMNDGEADILYMGRSEYHLVRRDGELKIALKKVELTNRTTVRGHLAIV